MLPKSDPQLLSVSLFVFVMKNDSSLSFRRVSGVPLSLEVVAARVFESSVPTCGITLRGGDGVLIAGREHGGAWCRVHAMTIRMVRFIFITVHIFPSIFLPFLLPS